MIHNLDTFTGFLLASYVLAISVFAMLTSFRMKNRRSYKDKFFRHSLFQLNKKQQLERGDLLILHRGFARKTGLQWSFVRFLEELCFFLTTGEMAEDNKSNEESYGTLYNRIKEIYELEQRVEPFDGLDDSTKNLLSDISKGVTMNDKEYVDNHLNALSLVIKENEHKYHTDHSINRWSLGLAISGLVISLILGYVTLTRKTSISDNDMKTITETIKRFNAQDGRQFMLDVSSLGDDTAE